MHRTYIEFISTCDVCLIFSLRCIPHLCRHAVYIALVECHIHRIWSLRVLHPPELQSDKCWMQYKLHSGQCDIYLIFKHLIYVSFLESHLCRIRYHMRRMSHLLIAINTASASICRAGGAGCVEPCQLVSECVPSHSTHMLHVVHQRSRCRRLRWTSTWSRVTCIRRASTEWKERRQWWHGKAGVVPLDIVW